MLGTPMPSSKAKMLACMTPHCWLDSLKSPYQVAFFIRLSTLDISHIFNKPASAAGDPCCMAIESEGVGAHPPIGSPMEASKPAETMMRSG